MNLRRFMHRTRKDQDLAEEIASHLTHEQDANAARGLSSQEARRRAYPRGSMALPVVTMDRRYMA
jgi:hypothetical protein